ncbi:MAG: hypothetical protein ACRDKB_04330 [Actinomycetota bacterium]
MDESDVRESAEAHAQAIVAGDIGGAVRYLNDRAKAQGGDVMKSMPSPLTGAEVTSIESSDDAFLVQIRYAGESDELVVESRWIEQDGRPTADDLKVV